MTPVELLQARSYVAASLVRDEGMAPEDALAFTVWPPLGVELAERRVPVGTIVSRACGRRGLNA